MGKLFDRVRAAASAGRYLIGAHAGNQLEDRGIEDWQVVAGLAQGRLICERPHDTPNPAVEVEQMLPDGTAIKAVWAWLPYHEAAKLVTVHFFDR